MITQERKIDILKELGFELMTKAVPTYNNPQWCIRKSPVSMGSPGYWQLEKWAWASIILDIEEKRGDDLLMALGHSWQYSYWRITTFHQYILFLYGKSIRSAAAESKLEAFWEVLDRYVS